jgi:hypothetical protein
MICNWFRNLGSRAISWTVRQVFMAAELYRLQRENERLRTEGEQLHERIEIVEKPLPEPLDASTAPKN